MFLGLSVSPSAQVGLTSEASVEPSIPGEGHAEDQQQGPQQKRKRASDLQDKGTYILEGQVGPVCAGCISSHLENGIWGPAGV